MKPELNEDTEPGHCRKHIVAGSGSPSSKSPSHLSLKFKINHRGKLSVSTENKTVCGDLKSAVPKSIVNFPICPRAEKFSTVAKLSAEIYEVSRPKVHRFLFCHLFREPSTSQPWPNCLRRFS